MPFEQVDAKANIFRCDIPRCSEEQVSYGLKYGGQPDGWKDVRLRPREGAVVEDYFILCPKHAPLAETLGLIGIALAHLGSQVGSKVT